MKKCKVENKEKKLVRVRKIVRRSNGAREQSVET